MEPRRRARATDGSEQRQRRRRQARRGGRPTSEQTRQLSLDVREAALGLFLEHGYEGTTLEAIAREAGTTKASLYVRFSNKESLFISVVRWATGRTDWPEPEPEPEPAPAPAPAPRAGDPLDPLDLGAALASIADAARRRATHPDMVKLQRMAIAQAVRFPDLAARADAASERSKTLVADLLRRHAATGAITAPEPDILAEHFLALVSCEPARLAALGIGRERATEQRHTRVAVELFLQGLRPA